MAYKGTPTRITRPINWSKPNSNELGGWIHNCVENGGDVSRTAHADQRLGERSLNEDDL